MATKIGPTHRDRPSNRKWRDAAACGDYPGFLDGYPEGQGSKAIKKWVDERLKVCNEEVIKDVMIKPACPVRAECLAYAESLPLSDIRHRGLIFGGLTGQQIVKRVQDRRREEREREQREKQENEEAAA